MNSPLLREAKERHKDITDEIKTRGEIRIRQHFPTHAGTIADTMPVDSNDSGRSAGAENPPRVRKRDRFQSPLQDFTDTGRCKSVVPIIHAARPVETRTPHQSPRVEEYREDEEDDGTPMDQILRKKQVKGELSRQYLQKGSNQAANNFSSAKSFQDNHSKPQPPVKHPNPQIISPEVFSLLSTPDDSSFSVATMSPPKIRSVPMKDRIMPIKKAECKGSNTATPKSPSGAKTHTAPKIPKKEKLKANEVILDPEIVRQQRAAQLIVEKEITGENQVLDLALFGEPIGESQEDKNKRIAGEAAKAKLAKEAKMKELMEREEAHKQAVIEKERVRKETEEKLRLRKEKEDEIKKARRDTERKKQEAEEARQREELRAKTVERIEADRRKATAEAEDKEREKQRAKERMTSVQVDLEVVAQMKAKQEEARRQAASLSSANTLAANKDTAENDDSLFIPEYPTSTTKYSTTIPAKLGNY